MTDAHGRVDPPGGPPRSLVFVARQRLLAETLGAQLAADHAWSVEVVDPDHPQLVEICQSLDPALVLLDVDDQVVPGLDLLSNVVAALPSIGVVVFGELGAEEVAEAIDRGARACLTYGASIDEVREVVAAAADGQTVVLPEDLTHLIEGFRRSVEAVPHAGPRLSGRELEVLRLVSAGWSTRAIADELGITVPTVRKHTQNVLAKLGVHSKLQAAAYAARNRLV